MDFHKSISDLITHRNSVETEPFVSVFISNKRLRDLVENLQIQRDNLVVERDAQRDVIEQQQESAKGSRQSKTEIKQREKIEKLHEQLNQKLQAEVEYSSEILKRTTQLTEQRDINSVQESTIVNLRKENERQEQIITQLEAQLQDAKSHSNLAEKQYDGLKETIRHLEDENENLKKTNEQLVGRIVTEKEGLMDQMNQMTDMIEKLKKEVEMLRVFKDQESRRKMWGKPMDSQIDGDEAEKALSRRFGSVGVVLPTIVKTKVKAHNTEATCVRYDSSGSDLVATASADSTLKLWDTGNGQLHATLRGGSGHVMLGVDISGMLAAGCGSDKTCRVWNTRSERMIHQLVGHSHKITCVRLFKGGKAILTGSADRSMKVWDITRNTYKQHVTLRHSSTANCIDVPYNSDSAISGHFDGGVRFWDTRTNDRIEDIPNLHIGGVTSVQFNPNNNAEVLTMGRDSKLKLIDARTCRELKEFKHTQFRIDLNYASCSLSPNGRYVAAGSGSTGDIFVWKVDNGNLETILKGHNTGAVGVAWGRGGTNGQQFSSVDKNGVLVLWA
eukprot:CAMPEP_0184857380 /NCGR_PEP_ID=MMETSP0580-20130426/2543_1 /TAXON_ID=1118495 /ORGANISM="Dactyliosolen fragilissimus" /LENGTH=557 /DNA_ID=CAMNT_0027352947 /DNA_START=72 /DNA_END=1745 /DNA_ORIENTATION=-